MMPDKEEVTLSPEDCAAMGMHIFPCRGKRPVLGLKWREESTRDIPKDQWVFIEHRAGNPLFPTRKGGKE